MQVVRLVFAVLASDAHEATVGEQRVFDVKSVGAATEQSLREGHYELS